MASYALQMPPWVAHAKPPGPKLIQSLNSSGTYLPIKWKIGSICYCKFVKRTICDVPLQFKPENGETAKYVLEDEIAAHEQKIF